MDPVSALGLAGAVVGIIDILSRGLSNLSEVAGKYRRANFTLRLVITQLSTLRAALKQLEQFMSQSLVKS